MSILTVRQILRGTGVLDTPVCHLRAFFFVQGLRASGLRERRSPASSAIVILIVLGYRVYDFVRDSSI